MKRIILDVDTGIDDAMAILLAINSPELEIEAITTVSGNVHVNKTSVNTLKVLEIAGVNNIPVARGMSKPILRELKTAEYVHGRDGLADLNLPMPRLKLYPKHGVDVIIECAKEAQGDITLVTTGPLTNVAMAILKEPEIVDWVKEMVVMGGAYGLTPYGYGNASPVAEFNIWCDPEAAKIVFESEIPITAVGLDVTMDPSAALTLDHLKELSSSNKPIPRFVAKLGYFYTERLKETRVYLHDPLTVAVAIDKSIVSTSKLPVAVEICGELTVGQTIIDRRKYLSTLDNRRWSIVDICSKVDGTKFLKMFMERIAGP